jgi:circadian clock protein KaiB
MTKSPKSKNTLALLERAQKKNAKEKYTLRLYISGITPRSTTAIERIRRMCEDHLKGRYDLEVVDIYQQPALAREEQIIAAPTLIKKLPLPLRRIIGDMSNEDKLLVGLDLLPQE